VEAEDKSGSFVLLWCVYRKTKSGEGISAALKEDELSPKAIKKIRPETLIADWTYLDFSKVKPELFDSTFL